MSSSFVDPTAAAVDHCESMSAAHPDLAEAHYHKIATCCQQKLWHQLTQCILAFVSSTTNVRTSPSNNFLALYDQVVTPQEKKLHPLSMARIAVAVANSLKGDLTAAKAILENLISSLQQSPPKDKYLMVQATMYLQSKTNLLTLQSFLQAPNQAELIQQDEVKAQLAEVYKLIKSNGVTLQEWSAANKTTTTSGAGTSELTDAAIVQAAHYEQSMTYYKLLGPPEAFYEQAMQFLTYAPPPDVSAAASVNTLGSIVDYHQLAVDLCLAALTGDGVYNLGQVEQTPCLALLANTPQAWLVEVLQAVALGKSPEFNALTQKYATEIQQQPALTTRAQAVEEKLTLMALVHFILTKHSHERSISFEELATALYRPVDQVEWVIMRACSVHLIEASIDQVDQQVTVTYVQPRVLNNEQMTALAKRFGEWAVQTSKMENYMKDQTQTLFA